MFPSWSKTSEVHTGRVKGRKGYEEWKVTHVIMTDIHHQYYLFRSQTSTDGHRRAQTTPDGADGHLITLLRSQLDCYMVTSIQSLPAASHA